MPTVKQIYDREIWMIYRGSVLNRCTVAERGSLKSLPDSARSTVELLAEDICRMVGNWLSFATVGGDTWRNSGSDTGKLLGLGNHAFFASVFLIVYPENPISRGYCYLNDRVGTASVPAFVYVFPFCKTTPKNSLLFQHKKLQRDTLTHSKVMRTRMTHV